MLLSDTWVATCFGNGGDSKHQLSLQASPVLWFDLSRQALECPLLTPELSSILRLIPEPLLSSFPFAHSHLDSLASCTLGYPELNSGPAQLCDLRLSRGGSITAPHPEGSRKLPNAFTQFLLWFISYENTWPWLSRALRHTYLLGYKICFLKVGY